MEGLSEKDQLVLALKAFIDMTLEERAALVASFVYDKAPGNLPISLSLCYFLVLY